MVGASPHSADAFWHDNCGDLTKVGYSFSDQARWTSYMKGLANTGFSDWDNHRKASGGWALTRDQVNAPQFTLRWADLAQGTFGYTFCALGANTISFSNALYSEFKQGTLELESLAAHEFGHAVGLHHTQYDPSDVKDKTRVGTWWSGVPTMMTGHPAEVWKKMWTLSRDEVTALDYTTNRAVSGDKQLGSVLANPSFETTNAYWQETANVSNFTAVEGASHLGGWYGSFRSDERHAGVHNTVRYIPLDDDVEDAVPRFYPYMAAKYASALHSGSIGFKTKIRRVSYRNIDSSHPEYKWGWPWDQQRGDREWLNKVNSYGPYVTTYDVCEPESALEWTKCLTPAITPPKYADAWDVRLRVESYLYGTDFQDVRALIDNATVYVHDLQHRIAE